MSIVASRYHDISVGHRVYQHESKCAHLHGHNYRIHFDIQAKPFAAELDKIGRVMDFSVIKTLLCMWLEDRWDHKFLVWEKDPWKNTLLGIDPAGTVVVPFNPTAENMAEYLVKVVAPKQFAGWEVELVKCVIEETRKCSVTYNKE